MRVGVILPPRRRTARTRVPSHAVFGASRLPSSSSAADQRNSPELISEIHIGATGHPLVMAPNTQRYAQGTRLTAPTSLSTIMTSHAGSFGLAVNSPVTEPLLDISRPGTHRGGWPRRPEIHHTPDARESLNCPSRGSSVASGDARSSHTRLRHWGTAMRLGARTHLERYRRGPSIHSLKATTAAVPAIKPGAHRTHAPRP